MLSHFKRWSPRNTARIDAASEHIYRSAPWPHHLTRVPVASYLAGRDGRYRLLAFDLDAGRFGPDAVKSDCEMLVAVLSDLGVPHLVVVSGPTGGRHIWVRMSASGVPAGAISKLARAVRAHLPTLDISPLTNPTTGAVRIPGAAHRLGGTAMPILKGDALKRVLDDMDATPSPPEIVDWLLARFPTIQQTTTPAEVPAVGIGFTGRGAGMRLNRIRTDLSPATQALLTSSIAAGGDRSAIAWSIMLGMAASGWAWAEVAAHLHYPGLQRLRDDLRLRESHALNQWQKALKVAAASAWPRNAIDAQRSAGVDSRVSDVLGAVNSHPHLWARKGWATAERVLYALIDVCTQAHTDTVDIDVRRLAESANVHASTASRSLHRLSSEGWVTCTSVSEGTAAATWRLEPPPSGLAATQVETRPPFSPPTCRLEHSRHDVWVWSRGGLGGVAERIHLAWLRNKTTELCELARLTCYTVRTVSRWLDRMEHLGLLCMAPRWVTVAEALGVDGTMLERARRHLIERLIRDWWVEELAWRKQRGKRLRCGPSRASTDPASLALPIAAPARARYGRFPTKVEGRVDYRVALERVSSHQLRMGVA